MGVHKRCITQTLTIGGRQNYFLHILTPTLESKVYTQDLHWAAWGLVKQYILQGLKDFKTTYLGLLGATGSVLTKSLCGVPGGP